MTAADLYSRIEVACKASTRDTLEASILRVLDEVGPQEFADFWDYLSDGNKRGWTRNGFPEPSHLFTWRASMVKKSEVEIAATYAYKGEKVVVRDVHPHGGWLAVSGRGQIVHVPTASGLERGQAVVKGRRR